MDEIAVLAGLQGEIATNAVLKAALCEKIEKTSVAEQRWTISFYVNFDTARTPHELSEFEKTKMIWNSEEFAKGVAIAKDVAVI